MPAKKRTPNDRNQERQQIPFKGFINVSLTEEDKDGFGIERERTDLVRALMQRVCSEGYNLSIKYDPKEDTFRCSLFCVDTNSSAVGYTLVMRSRDALTAMERVLFVHVYVLQEDWSDFVGTGRNDAEW